MVVQHMARFSVLEAQKIRIEPVPIKDTSCKRILIDSCVTVRYKSAFNVREKFGPAQPRRNLLRSGECPRQKSFPE